MTNDCRQQYLSIHQPGSHWPILSVKLLFGQIDIPAAVVGELSTSGSKWPGAVEHALHLAGE